MKQVDFSPVAALFESHHQEGFFPDAVYAIFTRDSILSQGVYGSAHPETWFDLASLTKLFTSTALLLLVKAGKLGLEQPVAPLLPSCIRQRDYSFLAKRLWHCSVRQLLTHTSGLIPWVPFYAQPKEFYSALQDVVKANPPLQGMHYSDLNFMLAGEILTQQTGLPLQQAISNVLSQLSGAQGSFFPPGSLQSAKMAQQGKIAISCYGNQIEQEMCAKRGLSYAGFTQPGKPVVGIANDGNCRYFFKGIAGHAGLFSPVQTLVELGRFYLASEQGSVFESAMQDKGEGRGLGFETGEMYPQGCGHTGFTGTSLWISKNQGIGLACLTNRLATPARTPKELTGFRKAIHHKTLELYLADSC